MKFWTDHSRNQVYITVTILEPEDAVNLKIQQSEAYDKKRIFLLDVKNQEPYVKIIESLQGEVASSYNKDVTHTIVAVPQKNRKLMCSIASGKWVLHATYLNSCAAANKWLPEEDYELGNPLSVNNIPKFTDQEQELADAAYRWRRSVKCGKMPYSGMKIVVINAKKDSYIQLITAGGGNVYKDRISEEATHYVLDDREKHITPLIEQLMKDDVQLLHPIFLGEHLYKNPMPPISNYVINKQLSTLTGKFLQTPDTKDV